MRIDFYIINDPHPQARDNFACRLIEKAYYQKHTMYVYTDNQQQAHTLDELLWTFRDDSFVPHNLQGEGPNPPPPIQIGMQQPNLNFSDILLNFSSEIPDFHRKFARIIEIIGNNDIEKNAARTRYRSYQQQQYMVNSHNIN